MIYRRNILIRDLRFVKSTLKADVNEMKENNMLRHIITYKKYNVQKNFLYIYHSFCLCLRIKMLKTYELLISCPNIPRVFAYVFFFMLKTYKEFFGCYCNKLRCYNIKILMAFLLWRPYYSPKENTLQCKYQAIPRTCA